MGIKMTGVIILVLKEEFESLLQVKQAVKSQILGTGDLNGRGITFPNTWKDDDILRYMHYTRPIGNGG